MSSTFVGLSSAIRTLKDMGIGWRLEA